MIDVGNQSFPVVIDYNNDGLLDIIIASAGYNNFNVLHDANAASLFLYENVGNDTMPVFELKDKDFRNS